MEKLKTKREQAVDIHLTCPDLTIREIGERLGWDASRVSKAITEYYSRRFNEKDKRAEQ